MKSALLGAVTLGAAALGAATLAATPARASLYNPVWTVSVWQAPTSGSVSTNAQLPAPTSTPTATFTYTGQLNFVPSTASPTFDEFFGGFTAISNFNSTLTEQAFGALDITSNSSSNHSYLEFSLDNAGTIGSGADLIVEHDRGASAYAYAGTTTDPVFSSSSAGYYGGPVGGPKTNVGVIPAGSTGLELVYVAEHAPDSYPTTTPILKVAVPEPGSLALLGTGLFGLGLIVRRRRRA